MILIAKWWNSVNRGSYLWPASISASVNVCFKKLSNPLRRLKNKIKFKNLKFFIKKQEKKKHPKPFPKIWHHVKIGWSTFFGGKKLGRKGIHFQALGSMSNFNFWADWRAFWAVQWIWWVGNVAMATWQRGINNLVMWTWQLNKLYLAAYWSGYALLTRQFGKVDLAKLCNSAWQFCWANFGYRHG